MQSFVSGGLRALERLRLTLSRRWSGFDRYGVLRSAVLGERPSGEAPSVLRSFGWVHLFNATGVHLYLVFQWSGSWALFLARRLRLRPSVALGWATALRGAAGLALWLLGGLRLGMARTILIFGVRRWARERGYLLRPWGALLGVLLLELVYRAWSDLSGQEEDPALRGGAHYFLTLAGGMLALACIERGGPQSAWREHLALAWGSWLPVALWDAAETGLIAPWTPFLNLLSAPLIGLALLPGAFLDLLAATLGFTATPPLLVALATGLLDQALSATLEWLPGHAAWLVVSRAAGLTALPLALLVLAWARARDGKRGAVLIGVVCAAVALGFQSWAPERESVRVIQRDVGQGDGAWVLGPDSVEALDAGGERARGFVEGAQELARLGIPRVDRVYLTHWDEDHSGGLKRLSALVPIGGLVAPPLLADASARALALQRSLIARGVTLKAPSDTPVGQVRWLASLVEPHSREGNARMHAYWVPLGKTRAYLNLGDAGFFQERLALSALPPGRSWTLKASHHGSRFSSGSEFLRALAPREAWISSGARNRYGHPTLEALERLRAVGARIRRTDREGELTATAPLEPARRQKNP